MGLCRKAACDEMKTPRTCSFLLAISFFCILHSVLLSLQNTFELLLELDELDELPKEDAATGDTATGDVNSSSSTAPQHAATTASTNA